MALPALHRREQDREVAQRGPVRELHELEEAARRLTSLVDQAWGTSLLPWPSLAPLDAFTPLGDVEETADAYLVELELPGVQRKDIVVEATGRQLTISGERKERERTGILRRRTRTAGRFFYEVLLPGAVDEDGITASLSDGVLTVTVPKAADARRKARQIPVR